ncbi:hypothetical protein KTAU_08400 [Thermogemmatispora aurantia]|uniref:Uncharacterized protein n=1 Tax=Thermogemmatispora aurantia TaxID=2045279 RepID=A0A5J4K542_9CHLR|nr:hypothetical protein KTAU_08400 [Thermogemmatispora aurantia]
MLPRLLTRPRQWTSRELLDLLRQTARRVMAIDQRKAWWLDQAVCTLLKSVSSDTHSALCQRL